MDTTNPHSSMSQIAASFDTKAAKIRALHKAGFRRSDIAKFLDVRYQYVRNVVVKMEEHAKKSHDDAPANGNEQNSRLSMSELTKSLRTKSDKIRTLSAAGYTRSDIAKFLGIRYQHVRNVLVAEEQKKQNSNETTANEEWVQVGPDGRTVIPIQYRRLLGVENGGPVRLIADGKTLRLNGRDEVLQEIRNIVGDKLTRGRSVVDNLLADRREETAHEAHN